MRLKLIACEILYREVCAVVARSEHQVDVEFMPKGLHDMGQERMSRRLVEAVGQVDESDYDAILLGYGLCSNGVMGLAARKIPLVVPRAHDCITLFLGSKERYLDYFTNHPGVYFKTSGWIERGEDLEQLGADSIHAQNDLGSSYEDLVAKYGPDNAKFLHEQLGDMTRHYRQITYIDMGVMPDGRFEDISRRQAQERGWTFERLQGDLSLLEDLVNGRWDEDRFLVVSPGTRIASSFDDGVVKTEPADRPDGP
ncbi:MAG: DUF1638 domain-containing protein [Pirellulales bacterium]|nr:DUF1638 domain-containing protein [Pirellulales bacterium]